MELLTNTPLTNLQNAYNEYSSSRFSSVNKSQEDMKMAGNIILFTVVLMISLIVMSFIAVGKFIRGNSESANTKRIVAYLLLIFSGFQLSWIYIILWISGANLGD
jgi:hypothetical protein